MGFAFDCFRSRGLEVFNVVEDDGADRVDTGPMPPSRSKRKGKAGGNKTKRKTTISQTGGTPPRKSGNKKGKRKSVRKKRRQSVVRAPHD